MHAIATDDAHSVIHLCVGLTCGRRKYGWTDGDADGERVDSCWQKKLWSNFPLRAIIWSPF